MVNYKNYLTHAQVGSIQIWKERPETSEWYTIKVDKHHIQAYNDLGPYRKNQPFNNYPLRIGDLGGADFILVDYIDDTIQFDEDVRKLLK